MVFHLPAYPHSHHRDNVVTPHGRPNLRSRLHYRHNQEGNHEVHKNMWWQWGGGASLVRFKFPLAMTTKTAVLWNVILCNLVALEKKKIYIYILDL